MRMPDLVKAFASFSAIMVEKKSISAKECKAVEELNYALSRTGYQIRPTDPVPHRRRRGRPVGSKNKQRRLRIVSGNEAHKLGKRKPGRPRLRKVA
jgi:hypothetical protein